MCGAMEADPFEQPYWNLDQYLIWLASRDPAAVLKATDCPNSGTNPPIGWRVYQEPNVDRQKVQKEAVRAIKGGHVKARVRFKGKWFTPDDPRWFGKWFPPDDPEDWVIEFEGKPNFAALLMRTTKHARREKVRPQFNPQIVARLYPPPSNLYDRPDVENPDVGPFVAYFDAWCWLTERNSLQELLPIDEAASRAEKNIRSTCMSTPKKLEMQGFYKNDAKLKPVTREDWQGLSINPLRGQPKTDLKAVGYRREYGAATEGDEYGPVIWTGLCFDRKQFVAAFTPPTQPCERPPRTRPLRERAQRALSELYPAGVPDQITDAELVKAVRRHIVGHGGRPVSRETILRAAGRLK
jgi:hypothetical protein